MLEPAKSRPAMSSVRDQNLSAILRELLREPQARKQLTGSTKIGSGTITRLVGKLIDAGYLEDGAPVTRPGVTGRPEVPLRFRTGDGKVLIGTQIQATEVTVDALTLTGESLLSVEREHNNSSRRAVLADTVALTREVIDSVGPDRTLGVGVSTGGHIDFATGQLISSPILGWSRTDLRAAISRDVDHPVVFDSSVRSLAVERFHWSPWAAPNMLVVVVVGAITSALMIGGELYRGSGASAGDITHFPVALTGVRPCDCGQPGCATTTLTDAALTDRAKDAGLIPSEAGWSAVFGAGPPQLVEMRRTRAEHLGRTVGQLMAMTDPDVVVIAGSIGSRGDIAECVRQARSTPVRRPPRRTALHVWQVSPHEWGGAAAALLLDDFLRHPTDYDSRLS